MDEDERNVLVACGNGIVQKYKKRIADLENENKQILQKLNEVTQKLEKYEKIHIGDNETEITVNSNYFKPDILIEMDDRMIFTQESFKDESANENDENENIDRNNYENDDITQISSSPQKAISDFELDYSQAEKININNLNCKKRRLHTDSMDQCDVKLIKIEPDSVSSISDSQGSEVRIKGESPFIISHKACMPRNGNSQKHIFDNFVNLTNNPVLKREWYREDFIKNPKFKSLLYDKATNIKKLSQDIKNYFQREQEHARNIAMKNFSKLADSSQDSNKNSFHGTNETNSLIKPLQNPEIYYQDKNINPIYKYNINEENLKACLNGIPNYLVTNFARDWDLDNNLLDDELDKCTDFLLTQDVIDKNERSKKKAKISGLKRLFQSCFVVKDGEQVGYFIFKNNDFNKLVCGSNFVIDLSIFK